MAQVPQPHAAVFQLVLAKFKASLTPQERRQFGATTLQDLHVSIESIQQKQRSERKLRAMNKLGRFLEGMHEYDKIITVFLNTSEILAFVWGPMKFLLQIASTFYEAFDTLLEAYNRIGEHLYLLTQYETYFENRTDMCRPLTLMYEDILEFHTKAMRFFKKRMWQQFFHALWKTFEFEFSAILRNLREHMTMIQHQATITQFAEILGAQQLVKLNMEHQREAETQRRRNFVCQWLSAANCESDQDTYASIQRDCPGSGQWLFQNHRFNSWFSPMYCSTHLLWINGIPGAGKTILASSIISEARKLPDVSVVFFYCRYKDGDRNTFLGVARGLLSQLLSQDDDLLTYLYEKASTSGQTTLSIESLARDLLTTSVKNFEKLYVVIDGLDECERDERKQIATFFEDIWNSLPQADADSLRCLFLSQDDNIARKDHANLSSLKITESHTMKDIAAYAAVKSVDIGKKFDLSLDRESQIRDKISSTAEGMFLFARLMASFLYDQSSIEDLENELSPGRYPEGPSKLDELYSRILGRLSTTSTSPNADALKVMTWMVCAKRPLKWREMQCAQSIDLDSQCVDLERRKFRVDSKDLCGSLAEEHADGTVVLVHQTAKRYLVDKKLVDVGAGELALATLCVSYLSFPGFDSDVDNGELHVFSSSGYYGFSDYAFAYWSRHIDAYLRFQRSQDVLDEVHEMIEAFVDMHWTEPQTSTVVPKSFAERWKPWVGLHNFDKVVVAGYLAQKQLGASTKQDPDSQVLMLQKTFERIRQFLEKMHEDFKSYMISMYGLDIFKCPRVNCTRFYNGFVTRQLRDEHVPKHERSYYCSFPGCPMSTLGCTTLKELHKHETEYHNALVIDEDELEYPNLPVVKEVYQCKQCDKKFTRNNNLKIHLRRAHSAPNEKGFICPQCGKSFARLGDRTRHETTIHSGAKSFTCGGVLKNSIEWGCGREFNRGDMLHRHWTSEKGKSCILPKQQEEAEEAASASTSTVQSNAATPI